MTISSEPRIWITGASAGIGRSIAIAFARSGGKVFASARRFNELEKLKKELSDEKIDIEIFNCDVSSYEEVERTAELISNGGAIDCLVNNAGITSFKKAEDSSIEEINNIIETNLLGAVYSIKSVLPKMIENKKGTIINVLSSVTKKVFTHSSAYSASKMGLLGFTNVLREEVRKNNIKVINIIPGATETEMWPEKIRKEKSDRMISSEDIADAVLWAFNQKENLVTEEIVLRPVQGDL